MRAEHLRRVERLEANSQDRPKMVVLVGQFGATDAVVEDYKRNTPEDKRAELIVCIARFTAL